MHGQTKIKSKYCVYTVLRYSWWWTVDMSETCRVLYQRNFEKLCISLAFIIRTFADIVMVYHNVTNSTKIVVRVTVNTNWLGQTYWCYVTSVMCYWVTWWQRLV